MQTVRLEELYGGNDSDELKSAKRRFESLKDGFAKYFLNDNESEDLSNVGLSYFSAPGRCEIIGNHTDHNGGKVIAASINMDTIAAAAPNNTDTIRIFSEEYGMAEVNLGKMRCDSGICKGSAALIAGISEAAMQHGYEVHGFDAYVTTQVIAAAGVSSSASYEMLVCSIINFLFNDNRMTENECAHFGQYAENTYWEKSSGLMDQIACAAGGAVYMDFKCREEVRYEKADISFAKLGYSLVLVNTGKGHADLSREYSAIPEEMIHVAHILGCERLCDSDMESLVENIHDIGNDRALLRAIHFYDENNRVDKMYDAMNECNTEQILSLIDASGKSSWELLQNCYCENNPCEQKIPLALALSQRFFDLSCLNDGASGGLEDNDDALRKGVCRVHGGGFAGVIMSVVPTCNLGDYVAYMSGFFGGENVHSIDVRNYGTVRVSL